jgi:hypothetical protein
MFGWIPEGVVRICSGKALFQYVQERTRLATVQFQKGNSGEPLDEGMTSNVAKMIAIGLKKRCISLGNQVESVTDVGEKINNLSKQLNAVAGIALVAVSMSDEGLLSKGMILTSLLSSNEPDEDLDTLFEDLC